MYVVLLSLQANTLFFCEFILHGFLNMQGYPRIKIHESDPSMGRRIKTVQQFEQVIEPYRMMFKVLNWGGGGNPHHYAAAKKKKNTKKTKHFGGGPLFVGFHALWELGSTTSHKLKSMRMSVNVGLQYNTA